MALTVIEYKEKQIYYNDWRNITNQKEFEPKIKEANENTKLLINEGKTDILILTDVTDSSIFGETIQMIKEAAKLTTPITKKSATVGLSSVKKLMLNGVNIFAGTKIRAFSTVRQAKEWLVND